MSSTPRATWSASAALESSARPLPDPTLVCNASSSSSCSDSGRDHYAAAPSNDEGANDSEGDEGEDSTASASEAEGATRRRRRQRIHFDVEQLQAVYHLPLKTVSTSISNPSEWLASVVDANKSCCYGVYQRLGICEAALKRICRRNSIRKWPYRQLSSVRRRIAELKDQRVAYSASTLEGDRVSTPHTDSAVRRPTVSAASPPEHLDARLQQLEAEQANIIRSAHHKRRPKKKNAGRQDTKTSWQQQQGPVPGEALTVLLHGYGTPTEQPAPLDLRRIDRDFPLLFLANVCESVRALHSSNKD
ncbi:hypothetical protein PHYSODRAFT_334517 [Phytophthora sojae]|uniref:RWP-RK domain-containing protein n=1 Tax=Phytophthora sojae (strain P6497) TaxID=1094619 RepID=G4ZPL3_PHYSP|nr:hypothetical protein PHYSODRAFT_334517 [Phytophthora sojae]EGZ16325.1 hypothetical protein PHYSODRAFT_334517 [Phytophthora sojae]|eukprot:XP_009530074.1 hypothetical protein PHYSODRAFT_334517 [Phytophthora sojae]